MKILILTPYIPYPVNSGGNQGFFGLIDRLRKKVDISIVLSAKPSDLDNIEKFRALWNNVSFHVYHKGEFKPDVKKPSYYNFLKGLRSSIERKLKRQQANSNDLVRKYSTITTSDFYMPVEEGYVNFIHDVIKSENYDLIQVDFFEYINMVNALPANIKKVFIHHELRYVREECEMRLFEKSKPMDYFLHNYSKSFEIGCLNNYDAVVTVTDVDKEKLKEELREDMFIESSPAIIESKNMVLTDNFKFNNRLIFLGGSDHFPNLDAVDWFLKSCWENIQRKNPDLELHIVGQWKSRLKKLYTERFSNIQFRGFVENLQDELQDAIMITPIRIGSGVRMKLLEAMEYGCPIVTTSVGSEGIGLENGQDCLIANNNISFAEAVLKLSGDKELCDKFRKNAKQKFEARPYAEQLAEVRLNIYKKILCLPKK